MALLDGKAGYVTGGGSGIGEAIAKRAAAEGASVLIADVDDRGGARVVGEIVDAGGLASFLHVDVSSEDDVVAMVAATAERYGSLDFAVNNAGFGHLPTPLHELDTALFDRMIAVNTRGVFLGLKHALAHMVEHGVAGSIVNTASGTGLKASKGLTGYVTSKHAVVGLTRNAAIDYAERGIRVNAIAPGSVATPAMLSQPKEVFDAYEQLMPSKRFAQPAEIAAAAVWLLSSESSYTSGDVVEVDFAYLQAG